MKDINTYHRVHQWIAYHYGKASKCENKDCTFKNPKRYEWALIKGNEYEKNINNFMQLCCSCHRKYDYTDEHRKKLSLAKLGKPPNNKGVDNRPIKICIVCNGKYKTYHKKSKICSLECRNKYNSLSKGKSVKNITHGTISGYSYHKCRCDKCKKKNTEYYKSKRNKQLC